MKISFLAVFASGALLGVHGASLRVKSLTDDLSTGLGSSEQDQHLSIDSLAEADRSEHLSRKLREVPQLYEPVPSDAEGKKEYLIQEQHGLEEELMEVGAKLQSEMEKGDTIVDDPNQEDLGMEEIVLHGELVRVKNELNDLEEDEDIEPEADELAENVDQEWFEELSANDANYDAEGKDQEGLDEDDDEGDGRRELVAAGKIKFARLTRVKCEKPAKSTDGATTVLFASLGAVAAAGVAVGGILLTPVTAGASAATSAVLINAGLAAAVTGVGSGLAGGDMLGKTYSGTDDLYISADGHKVWPSGKYEAIKSQQVKEPKLLFRLPVTLGLYEHDSGSADDFMGNAFIAENEALGAKTQIVFNTKEDSLYAVEYTVEEFDEDFGLTTVGKREERHPLGSGCDAPGCLSGNCHNLGYCQCKVCKGSGCGGCTKGHECYDLSIYEPNECLAVNTKFHNGKSCANSGMCHSKCCSWTAAGANTCENDTWYRNCT